MKSLLSTEVLEANMRVYLALLEKTVIKYWEPKSEIIIQLWEYFQKRLNNTFYVPGSNLDSMTIMRYVDTQLSTFVISNYQLYN